MPQTITIALAGFVTYIYVFFFVLLSRVFTEPAAVKDIVDDHICLVCMLTYISMQITVIMELNV